MPHGLSPLIAAVLLIAFTVVTAVFIMGWAGTLAGSVTTTTSNKTADTIACGSAQMSIDDVYLSAGQNGSVVGVIRNTGFTNLQIIGAQLYNIFGENMSTTSSLPTNLDSGAIQSLVFSFTSAQDYSPYGNNGTLVNGPMLVAGRYGSGLSFDGTNDYVGIGNPVSLNVTNTITISAWINKAATQASTYPAVLERVESPWGDEDVDITFANCDATCSRIGFGLRNATSTTSTEPRRTQRI